MWTYVTPKTPVTEAGNRRELLELLERMPREYPFGKVLYPDDTVVPPPRSNTPDRARVIFGLVGARPILIPSKGQARTIRLGPGDVLWLHPRVWHLGSRDVACTTLQLTFDPDYTSGQVKQWRAAPGTRPQELVRLNYYTHAHINGTADRIVQTLNDLAFLAGRRGAEASLLRALIRMVRQEMAVPPSKEGKARSTWQALCDYAREHFHEPINRDSVARAFGLHPNHVSRLFRQQGGQRFSAYLTGLRMEHAAALQQRRHLTVKELAAHCGFRDERYFIRVFRRHHGTTPGRYGRGT